MWTLIPLGVCDHDTEVVCDEIISGLTESKNVPTIFLSDV